MNTIKIGKRRIGHGFPTYVVAELSANHGQDFEKAVEIIRIAKKVGADAVKIQTYTPDTLTINCDNKYFKIKGTIWKNKNLYELYREAYTPWEWQPKLKKIADKLKIDFFSTAFDPTSVDFLEKLNVPAYKISSFELVDLPLIKLVAQTGKPMIISTGMATEAEISSAVKAAITGGCREIALLKCVSAYPADPTGMNLNTIPDMERRFGVVSGVSDHSLGSAVAIAAVALGACIVEKHITLSRADGGPDSAFSMEPDEFADMVKNLRMAEAALGLPRYGCTPQERASKIFRRSLFAVKDIRCGELFTKENVRSIRPAYGLSPALYDQVLGSRAACFIPRGTPLKRVMIRKRCRGLADEN